MKNKNLLVKIVFIVFIVLLLLSLVVPVIFSQTAPKKETLLNGLKVLMWADPKADKVSVRIRIHAGSAFDPQGKEGVMQMLSDNLFPNEAAREFFAEDLGGGLEVVTNYDYIQVNASAKPDQFLTMLETLASAVSNPPIDKENTAKLRNVLTAKVKTLESDPAYVADQAVAKRLFGTFPYGRPQFGTDASLQKIEYPDLVEARQRFLTADNATIAVSGNVDRSLALRAIKRYFGGWLKADKKAPSTFRQPDEPDTKPLLIPVPGTQRTQIRYALRGLAESDSDSAAAQILARILEVRLQRGEPKDSPNADFAVRHEAHVLPGALMFSHSFIYRPKIEPAPNPPAGTFTVLSGPPDGSLGRSIMLISKGITIEEFSTAKNAVAGENNAKSAQEWWLDQDTFKTLSASDGIQAVQRVSLADVQRVADQLAKNPVVAVIVHSTGESATKTN